MKTNRYYPEVVRAHAHDPKWNRSRMPGSLLLCLTIGLLALSPASAQFDPLPFIKIEAPRYYVQGTMHLAATNFPDIHAMTPPGAFWSTPFQIGEQAYGSFLLRGTNQHIVRADALDAPKGGLYPYKANLTVGFGEGIVDTRFASSVAHPPHQDAYVVAFAAFSIVREWLGGVFWNETRGHVHGSLGVHLPFPKGGGGGGGNVQGLTAILTGASATPTNDSTGVGCLVLIADLVSNTMSFQLTVQNITPDEITAASIQLGAQGPPIFHFSSWQPFENGSRCSVEDVPIQTQLLPMLLTGQCYANLSTTNHPEGELAGQITAVPVVVRLDPPVVGVGQAQIDFYVENGFPQGLQLQVADSLDGSWQDSGVTPQFLDTNHYQAIVPVPFAAAAQFFRGVTR